MAIFIECRHIKLKKTRPAAIRWQKLAKILPYYYSLNMYNTLETIVAITKLTL